MKTSYSLPRVVQVCRRIAPGGGVGGVVLAIESELSAIGFECTRITADSFWHRPRASSRPGPFAHAFEVLSFSFSATRAVRKVRSTDAVVIVHNDALGGDIYVNHGLHKALVAQQGWRMLVRNPLHGFLLMREEVRHRWPSYRTAVCLSDGEVSKLRKHYGVSAERCSVISNGVDTQRFFPLTSERRLSARRSWGVSDDTFVLLFVGHEFDRKGLASVLEALRELPNDVVLWVVGGSDSAAARWRRRADSEGLGSRVRFYGSTADVVEFYHRADVFVLPSLFEASPLVSLEAMSSGLPCLLSTGAGGEQYLQVGQNGYRIDSPADIAAHVAHLRGDPGVRLDLAVGARDTALSYSWAAIATRYSELIQRVWTEKNRTDE
ncbi:MAG TPA: glycosyltransferase family 4 protein [Acidothermaceae bacterium]|nr:glycosyltransferase family 4 protein [Acidothermaceae bacterium]